MFGFGKKMTPEEIAAERARIDQMIDQDDLQGAFNAAEALNKKAPGEGAVYLARGYTNGWGGEENSEKAYQYAIQATNLHPDDSLSWYFAGYACLGQNNREGFRCFMNCYKAGDNDGSVLAGFCAYLISKEIDSNIGLHNLNIRNSIAQLQATASYLYIALDLYFVHLQQKHSRVDPVYLEAFTRCAENLYTMACDGLIGLHDKRADSNAQNALGWLTTSFEVIGNKNSDAKEQHWGYIVALADKTRQDGARCASEYILFRGCLTEAEKNKSADAYYRAVWHLYHAMDLKLKVRDASYRDQLSKEFINDTYHKMKDKYERSACRLVASGIAPQIEKDYPEGAAPEVESSEAFMKWYEEQKAAASAAPAAPAASASSSEPRRRGGLFGGLFGKK